MCICFSVCCVCVGHERVLYQGLWVGSKIGWMGPPPPTTTHTYSALLTCHSYSAFLAPSLPYHTHLATAEPGTPP